MKRTAAIVFACLVASAARASAEEPSAPPEPAPSPPPAAPAGVDPEAIRLYQEGLRHYQAGEYDRAIADLEASYARAPAPGLLYNLAQAHRLAHDCARALALYRRFLESAPAGETRLRAEDRASEMDRCVAAEKPPAPPPAAPPPKLAATEKGGLEARLAPPPPPRPFFTQRRVTLASGALAVALAATSGYFAWQTSAAGNEVSAMFTPMNQWGSAGMNAQSRGQLDETLAWTAGVAAVLTGGYAAWRLLRD
jgi:tetratricopeptide (TPR) repeat protein